MPKTRSVTAIQNGTVIDHIPACQALQIIPLLEIEDRQVTLGLNLPSQRLGSKDVIKIKDQLLTPQHLNQVAVFAPQATVNLIREFSVKEKKALSLPSYIKGLLACPNLNCITRHEIVDTHFTLNVHGKRVQLTCYYCEKYFDRTLLGRSGLL